MWFLGAMLAFLLLAFFLMSTGWSVLQIVFNYKKNLRSPELLAVCAIMGTAVIMLLTGTLSYLGLPAYYIGSSLLIIFLCLFGYVLYRTRTYSNITAQLGSRFYYSWVLMAVCFFGAFLMLVPLYLHDAYNPFNDTFTYLCISDYLQDHPFSQHADPGIHFPLLSQVSLYQDHFYRMGANFFLAFVQSIFPVHRSYEIYPTVVAWALVLNFLSIYLGCRWIIRIPRFYALMSVLLTCICLNPLYYAAITGFFPQLMGLSFFIFSLCLLARWDRMCYTHYKRKVTMLLAFGGASIISAYGEIFPLFALIFATVVIIQMLQLKQHLKNNARLLLIFVLCLLFFAHIETYRMFFSLMQQLNAVVGGNIAFTPFEFIAMGLGIQRQLGFQNFDIIYQLFGFQHIEIIFNIIVMLFFILFFLGSMGLLKKRIRCSLVWLMSLIVFGCLIFYYTVFAVNPWTYERGQTWALFKLIGWIFPLVMITFAAGMKLTRLKKSYSVIFCVLMLIFLPAKMKIFDVTTSFIRSDTFSDHPFAGYLQLTEMAYQLTAIDTPIEIKMDDSLQKHKQILAYFLYPHPVIGDWRGDGYFSGWKQESRYSTLDAPHLVLTSRKTIQPPNSVIFPGGTFAAIQ